MNNVRLGFHVGFHPKMKVRAFEGSFCYKVVKFILWFACLLSFFAIMVDVYHELEFPYEVLASLVRALKPGGRIVFVEYRAEDAFVPIKTLHKMTEAQVKREAAVHPLVWERTAKTLPWQHAVFFRRR